jgi:hypothetical protein
LNYVGGKFAYISEVSNKGGKYGQRSFTLNTGCKRRNGGILDSK